MGFVDVRVEAHEALPDGCSMRFKACGEVRPVARIRYESEDGVAGTWTVHALSSDGNRSPARTVPVEDSSAGSSNLVFGGDHGLRLTSIDTGAEVAEPFLLLSDASLES
jgi:hypothetical protein